MHDSISQLCAVMTINFNLIWQRPSLTGTTKKHSLNWSGTRVKKWVWITKGKTAVLSTISTSTDCIALLYRQISKKHQIRLDTPWLDPSKTLAEQEVTESDELILMYRFYYHMELDRFVCVYSLTLSLFRVSMANLASILFVSWHCKW